MTAEIALANRQAIVLAADSAVTIGRERVWKHANKIFSLGPTNDIAIMIYGSGEFAGFPWETIIKTFRSELGDRQFDTVRECGEAFQQFLRDARFKPDSRSAIMNFALVLDQLERMKKQMPPYGKKLEFRKHFAALCAEFKSRYEREDTILPGQTYKDFCKSHPKDLLRAFAQDTFEETITDGMAEKMGRAFYEFAARAVESPYSSGVVVAGYGAREFFPAVYEHKVDGRDEDFVRTWSWREHNLNDDNSARTLVLPFAQVDIFYLFMEGISLEYNGFIRRMLSKLLDDKSDRLVNDFVANADERLVEAAKQKLDNRNIIEGFEKEFKKYRNELIVQPIVRVVQAIPKEEMADMALALVELTSLRRKVETPLESVGGPVDVAVISKGDGLIWIKRKHYFDIDFNQEYLHRKAARRRKTDGQVG